MQIRWGLLFAVAIMVAVIAICYQAYRTTDFSAIASGAYSADMPLDHSVVSVVYFALFLLFLLGVIRLWLNHRDKSNGEKR